jgi:hypothetical protein
MPKGAIDYKKLLNFGDLVSTGFYQNFSFVLFIFFLLLVYIANAHYAERKVKEIQTMQKEIKELRWQYMSIKSKVMYRTKHSEVAKDVGIYGLGVMNKKPYRIVVD